MFGTLLLITKLNTRFREFISFSPFDVSHKHIITDWIPTPEKRTRSLSPKLRETWLLGRLEASYAFCFCVTFGSWMISEAANIMCNDSVKFELLIQT